MDDEIRDLLTAIRDALRDATDPLAAAVRSAADQALDGDPEGAAAELRYAVDEREAVRQDRDLT